MSNANGIIESLIKENEDLRQENRQLREIVETLNRKINTLEEKLAASKKNSRNSSKPASSDIVKPKKPKTSENEGKRKAGDNRGREHCGHIAISGRGRDHECNAGVRVRTHA